MIDNFEILELHKKQIVDFSISSDFKKIAYVYGNFDLPHSLYSYDIMNREIHIYDIEKGIDIFVLKGKDQHAPSWSNDGKHIAFLSIINNKTQLSIFSFEENKIMYSSCFEYTVENAFYGIKSKNVLWSDNDKFMIIPYYENGNSHYKQSENFTQTLLVLDLFSLSIKQILKSNNDYRVYGFYSSTKIVYSVESHLCLYNIDTEESTQTKFYEHSVIKPINNIFFFTDVNKNLLIFGKNDSVLISKEIEGDLIKPIGISDDGSFSVFVIFHKMSVYLVKLDTLGKIEYLSAKNEVTFNGDNYAEPKIVNNKIMYIKSSKNLHFEFFIDKSQITFINKTIIEKLDIEIISDTYVSDDCNIDTTILLPKKYNENKEYPALIYIHGGPNTFESMTIGNLISSRGQSIAVQLCQEGFVVAIPNYRGTRGYGSKHLEKVLKFSMEYSNYVFEDIINCKRMLLKKYRVDKNKIGLYGSSYGAQVTGWVIANSDYFKAAGGIIAVSYDDDNYSIESRVEKINCPLIIVETGMAEGRFEVGKKIYNKLVSLKKDSEYYLYPHAFHNGGWNDEYKLNYILKMTDFFKRHLSKQN